MNETVKRGRTPGESLAIASWLHRQALRGVDGGTILEGLCSELLAAGLDIGRAVTGYLVFHPQFDAINFTWTHDTNTVERQAVTRSDMLQGPSPFLLMQLTELDELHCRLQDADGPLAFPFLERLRDLGFTEYLARFESFGTSADPALWPDMPEGTAMHEGVTTSFATRRAAGFDQAELALLRSLSPPLAVAVKVGAEREMAETLLGAYLGRQSGRSVLRGHVRRGQGRVIHAVVWHSDMRGSTDLAERVPLETYLATLNSYYDCVVDAVVGHGGEVLKFVGDGVIAIFPFDPGADTGARACGRAVAAARAALDRLAKANAERSDAGSPSIRCGIALHAGDLMYGNVGSAQRLDFMVMGRTVNETVRLERLCKALEVPLVVSEAVASLHGEPLDCLGSHELPGVGRAMRVYSLRDALAMPSDALKGAG